jgi:hypothetical protein
VCDAHLASILRVDLSSDLFAYDIDEKMRARAERIDVKLVLITNMPDHTPQEVVARYKALADIERGFRVLKSEIEIAPVFHRLPQRIRKRAAITPCSVTGRRGGAWPRRTPVHAAGWFHAERQQLVYSALPAGVAEIRIWPGSRGRPAGAPLLPGRPHPRHAVCDFSRCVRAAARSHGWPC